ncbi:MAG: tetratricopeptide repeat protein [Thermoleophilia bacterium]
MEVLATIIAGIAVAAISFLGRHTRLKIKQKRRLTHQKKDSQSLSVHKQKHISSNLPSGTKLIGREKEKERLIEALNLGISPICIEGIGGIGKTSLALEVANSILENSKKPDSKNSEDSLPIFDGFIWTTAKNKETNLEDILDTVARVLDCQEFIQHSLQEKKELIQALLSKNRYLILVDNFETIEDKQVIDFLSFLPASAAAIITSREQKFNNAWDISLNRLNNSEAQSLIRREGKRLNLRLMENANDATLLQLYKVTGGAPLAIIWAMGQMKQKGQAFDTVLAHLENAQGNVFEEIFSKSWSLLKLDAKKILTIMPLFAASVSKDAIANASNVYQTSLEKALGQLVQMRLLEVVNELEDAKIRYNIHPLTRAFCIKKIQRKSDLKNDAICGIAKYYLGYLKQYGGENWSGYDLVELERQNIIQVINLCYETEKWEFIIQFRNLLTDFLGIRGYWNERVSLARKALEAYRILDRPSDSAICMIYDIGWTLARQGKKTEANTCTIDALNISKEHKDSFGIALAYSNLGYIYYRDGKITDAEKYFLKGLEYGIESKNDFIESHIRINLGNYIYLGQGKFEEARQHFEAAHQRIQRSGKGLRLSLALYGLGKLEYSEGNIEAAENFFKEALKLTKTAGKQHDIALITKDLAQLKEKSRNKAEALKMAKESYEIFSKLGIDSGVRETGELIKRLENKR